MKRSPLLRLVGYARPYAFVLLAGVLCAGLYSGARMARTWLIMPLIDDVLPAAGATPSAEAPSLSWPGLEQLVTRGLPGAVRGGGAAERQPAGGIEHQPSGEIERQPAGASAPALTFSDRVFGLLLAGVLLALVLPLAHFGAAYLTEWALGRVLIDIQREMAEKLLSLPLGAHHELRRGDALTRTLSDALLAHQALRVLLADVVEAALFVVASLATLLLISWQLTLLTMFALPLMVGLWNRFRDRVRRGVLKVWNAVGELSSHIQETIGGVRLVKASGAESYERDRFRELTRRHYKAVVRNERWRQFFPSANEMIIATALLAVLYFGSRLVLVNGTLEPDAFIAFAVMAARILSPVKWLGKFPSVVQPGLAAGERAFELLDERPAITEREGARPIEAFREAIRLEGVSFEYEAGEPVLRDVDLEIARGDVVALVGPSGAGKTTIANLVPRFYDPTAGRITIDGLDLRDLRIDALRALMAIVTQETILFHDTVRSNIAYGLEH
ncbi:MAG TPA: ABC transporter ATP-binding protein, partial [Myxococcota bacterium]|nr:ABC transporter ATP-binding protein [Myxococcota bacterium]